MKYGRKKKKVKTNIYYINGKPVTVNTLKGVKNGN